jgi:hypothetical protein
MTKKVKKWRLTNNEQRLNTRHMLLEERIIPTRAYHPTFSSLSARANDFGG